MPRDAHIPLFLWIATALLVHMLGGGSAHEAAVWLEERIELRRFAEGVRSYVKSSHDAVEIALLDETAPQPEPSAAPKPEPSPDAKPARDEDSEEDEKKPLKTATPEPKPEPEKPDLEPQEPEKKPEEEKKVAEPEKVVPAQELVLKKSIAVRQHVKDEKQPDNPDAEFIAEHNNKVSEQTQARITANDQNDPDPTPGSSASGVGEQPGDSHETRIAESEDRPGEEARAPSDEPAPQRPKTTDALPNAGAPEAVAEKHAAPTRNGVTSGVQKPPERAVAKNASPGSQGRAEQKEQTGAPDLVASDQGAGLVAKAQVEQAEQEGQRARKKRKLPQRRIRGAEDMFGLGASGTTASGINLNLTPGLAANAIGSDQLSRERRADSARRRSAHLGSWKTNGIERWRSAIENYVPSVKPGNQTALNTARSPFGTYLSMIHNRLHPIFADWFLASLDSLDRNNPMNRPDLSTNLEITLDQDEGRIVRMGVTKHSGVTAFDIAALDSVQRASPFGPPPHEIVSPDGKVYLHWEFHRDPNIACTTYNARPYMLKAQPKTAPPTLPPPVRPDDEGSPEERHGSVEAPALPARSL
ncbi:MAG TPA: TonB C-terminal domain-containing protein [Polyangiaceae bacterium]|nr:TonB C-terminal domain-containing protein [Polyangiaceae bacterium]